MQTNILNDTEYKAINTKHICDTIQYLFDKSQPFSIFCLYDYVSFNPELPSSIRIKPQPYIIFNLDGYTFESATIIDDVLEFEAGFGPNNFASIINIPLLAIQTINIGEETILVNLTKPTINRLNVPSFMLNQLNTKKVKKDIKISNKSMEALLKNPENQKLIKKKKK